MNIAFWSEEGGCGTTSSMAAVASVCSDAWNMKTILLQSRNQEGDLWKKLGTVQKNRMVCKDNAYPALNGLDYLLWQAKNKRLTDAVMLDSMVPVVKERMYYLPQGRDTKSRVYPQSLKVSMCQIVRQAEQLSDLTFIDCGSGKNELTDALLAMSDIVVVSLPQNRSSLESYFVKKYIFSEKVVYLMNCYQQDSACSRKDLTRLYRVREEDLGVILYNPIFRHASDKGRTERFVRRHIRGASVENQYEFMQELMQTTRLILKHIGIEG